MDSFLPEQFCQRVKTNAFWLGHPPHPPDEAAVDEGEAAADRRNHENMTRPEPLAERMKNRTSNATSAMTMVLTG
ncbi:MAG: hypothetical protein OEQ39_21465 [Gammaproteobacteria bacterium]|nr:hypothetical protein [Gammaproteobacteria bacterium]